MTTKTYSKKPLSIKSATKVFADSVRKDIIKCYGDDCIPMLAYTVGMHPSGMLSGHCNWTIGATGYFRGEPSIDDVIHSDMLEFNNQINEYAQAKLVQLVEKWLDLINK